MIFGVVFVFLGWAQGKGQRIRREFPQYIDLYIEQLELLH